MKLPTRLLNKVLVSQQAIGIGGDYNWYNNQRSSEFINK